MLDKPLGDDLRHDFVGVVDALAALKPQGERQRVGEVGYVGGRQLIGVGHANRIAARIERNKNIAP